MLSVLLGAKHRRQGERRGASTSPSRATYGRCSSALPSFRSAASIVGAKLGAQSTDSRGTCSSAKGSLSTAARQSSGCPSFTVVATHCRASPDDRTAAVATSTSACSAALACSSAQPFCLTAASTTSRSARRALLAYSSASPASPATMAAAPYRGRHAACSCSAPGYCRCRSPSPAEPVPGHTGRRPACPAKPKGLDRAGSRSMPWAAGIVSPGPWHAALHLAPPPA